MPTFEQSVASRIAVGQALGETAEGIIGGIDPGAVDPAELAADPAFTGAFVQPGDLAAVATSGDYDDLTGKPTLGTAAATAATDYATAAQGALADTAVQPDDLGTAAAMTPTEVVEDAGAQAVLTGVFVAQSTLDANTLLGATADNTPIAFPVAASRIVGRKATGDIDDMTTAEVAALFGTPTGSKFLADDGTLKTPSSGGSPAATMSLNKYRTAPTWGVASSNATLTANRLYLVPLYVPAAGTLVGLAQIVTTFHASGVSRLGAYSIDNGKDPASGVTLISDFGTVGVTSNGTKVATGSVAVTAGYILLALSVGASAHAVTGTYGGSGPDGAYQQHHGFNDATSHFRGIQGWSRSGNVDAGLPSTIAAPTVVETNFDFAPYVLGRIDF